MKYYKRMIHLLLFSVVSFSEHRIFFLIMSYCFYFHEILQAIQSTRINKLVKFWFFTDNYDWVMTSQRLQRDIKNMTYTMIKSVDMDLKRCRHCFLVILMLIKCGSSKVCKYPWHYCFSLMAYYTWHDWEDCVRVSAS